MSKDLVKVGRSVLATESARDAAGMNLVKVGGGGLVAMVIAGLLPFVTLPMILVLMVVLGFVL